MAKTGGLGDNFYIAGVDVSGDINSVQEIGGGPSLLEFTGINSSGVERRGGVRSGRINATAYYNPTGVHPTVSALPTADAYMYYAFGTTLGNSAACLVGKQIGYDGNRADDGSFKLTVEAMSNGYGIEFGTQLTAGKRSDTTATTGTAYDSGAASTTFGLQAYLQVFSFTGTSCTIKLQESSDNGADAYADVVGGTFGAQSAIGASRIATATNLTVERYLRVTTTGTFSQCTFAVAVVRNQTLAEF